MARVLVAGANGFTGALAAKIVWGHPRLELVRATSRSDAGRRIEEISRAGVTAAARLSQQKTARYYKAVRVVDRSAGRRTRRPLVASRRAGLVLLQALTRIHP